MLRPVSPYSIRRGDTMNYAFLGIRSLTYAQRAVRLLDSMGIRSQVERMPYVGEEPGCSYAVRTSTRELSRAFQALQRSGFVVRKVLIRSETGALTLWHEGDSVPGLGGRP